jgi:hypothetical protein
MKFSVACKAVVVLAGFSLFSPAGLVPVVFAQSAEADRGRLPDGRAYRTDQEGNQLVDYIAELELEKEGLENRIFALQDEVRDARAKQPSKAVETQRVVETTQPVVRECPAITCPKLEPVVCPAVSAQTIVKNDCTSFEMKLAAVKSDLEKVTKEASQADAERTTLVEQLGGCQGSVERVEREAVSLRESVADMRRALAERDNSLLGVRAEVAQLREAKLAMEQQRKAQDIQLADLQRAKASNSASIPRDEPRAALRNTSASSISRSASSSAALVAGRSQLLARISMLEEQVRARDAQFARLDQRGKALQIKPAALRTRSGFELRTAKSAIQGAETFRELSNIGRELDVLSGVIADDIRLGARLK